ncbi:MAG: hypothetical protein WCR67_00240 [Bacilli bacterium]
MKKHTLFSALLACFVLAGCGGSNKLATPTEFEYTVATGAFKFKGVENAETYTINVYEVLPDALVASLATGDTTKKEVITYNVDGKDVNVWQCSIGSRASMKAGTDGYISNKIAYYSYSSSAMSGGSPISCADTPLTDYVAVAMASKTDTHAASDPALISFRHTGTLATPSSITYTISDE